MFLFRKIENIKEIPQNTKHMFAHLPNGYSVPYPTFFAIIGLAYVLIIDDYRNVENFESYLPFFNPARHVPPTITTNDMNIYLVQGYIFATKKPKQNLQILYGTGGCDTYVCKYIAKIDYQN